MATLGPLNDFTAGTTIVAADMNQNFTDIETFVNTTPGVVQKDIVDAKGDLIVATSADAVSRLAVGTNDYVLTAASGEATGLKWATPSAAAACKLIEQNGFSRIVDEISQRLRKP